MSIIYRCDGCAAEAPCSRQTGALPPEWTVRFVDEGKQRTAEHYCAECQVRPHAVRPELLAAKARPPLAVPGAEPGRARGRRASAAQLPGDAVPMTAGRARVRRGTQAGGDSGSLF
jgi:hypothetical protein